MSAGGGRAAVAGVEGLDAVGGVDDLADRVGEGQERYELALGALPDGGDTAVLVAPLGVETMTWLDAPEGVLSFHRDPGFVCVVNLSDEAYQLPDHTAVLLASGSIADGQLDPDRAVWLKV